MKCWPDFFDATERGDKTFEIRKNDRGFQRGDTLILRKWDPEQRAYIPKGARGPSDRADDPKAADTLRCTITYVLNSNIMESGYVVMSIRKIDEKR